MTKKVYLNWHGPQGRETVYEFEKQPGQTIREFRKYVREMIAEYSLVGMNVYESSRCCKNWLDE